MCGHLGRVSRPVQAGVKTGQETRPTNLLTVSSFLWCRRHLGRASIETGCAQSRDKPFGRATAPAVNTTTARSTTEAVIATTATGTRQSRDKFDFAPRAKR